MGIRKLHSRQSLKFQAFSSCKRLSLLPDVISEFFPEQSAEAYFLSAREVAPFNGQSGKAAVLCVCVCMYVCMCVSSRSCVYLLYMWVYAYQSRSWMVNPKLFRPTIDFCGDKLPVKSFETGSSRRCQFTFRFGLLSDKKHPFVQNRYLTPSLKGSLLWIPNRQSHMNCRELQKRSISNYS